jgi:hypothetical protein
MYWLYKGDYSCVTNPGGVGKRGKADFNVDLVANEHHSTLPDVYLFPTIPRAIETMIINNHSPS